MKHARKNNTKRRVAAAALLAALAAFAAMGSLAYFNVAGKADNVITTKGIEADLAEYMVDPLTGELVEYRDPEYGVMPGDVVSKIPVAEASERSAEAWVRMSAEVTVTSAGGQELDPWPIWLDYNDAAWTDGGDGWWYCDQALQPGGSTEPLFTCACFSSDAGNDYQRSTIKIAVRMQAVQTANNGNTATEAAGWPSAN